MSHEKMTPFDIHFLMKVNDLGIIPFCDTREEFLAAMATLSGKEKRSVKRKFRKLWRILAKQHSVEFGLKFFPLHEKKSGRPSRTTRRFRQRDLMREITSDVKQEMKQRLQDD